MSKKILTVFVSLLIIISCASKDEQIQTIKDYVDKISAEIKFEDGFDAIKVRGEKRSRFRSYYQNNELVFINEDMNIGIRGNSSNKYFFRNGELVYFSEQTILSKDDSLKINTKTMIKSEVYFDTNIELFSERIINGTLIPFSDLEIKSILEHSQILKDLADITKPEIPEGK